MKRRSEALLAYLCLTPAAILLCGVILYPIGRTVVASFCQVDKLGNPQHFGTLDNYRWLLTDEHFLRRVVPHTLIWTLAVVAFTIAISILVALVLHEKLPGQRLMRGIILLPWATSLVISAAIWKWILHPTQGPLNGILMNLGLVKLGTEPAWLAYPTTALVMVILVGIWVSIPFTSVVLLAGLQSITEDLYEAAVIDGAGIWQRFRRITLPLLKPVLLVAVLLNTIYVFNSFPIIWTLTEGGPANETHIIVTYLYKTALWNRDYGPGYAMATLTFAFLLAFSIVYTRVCAKTGLEAT
jgi:multiple sugar transport system permease protein